MNLKEMELAIRNLQRDVKSILTRNYANRIDKVQSEATQGKLETDALATTVGDVVMATLLGDTERAENLALKLEGKGLDKKDIDALTKAKKITKEGLAKKKGTEKTP